MKSLILQASIKFFVGFLLVGILIFLPALSLSYWNGWLLMGLLFIPMFIVGLILLWKNPELLKRRLESKEKEESQKAVILLSGIMFLSGFIVAGLNYHFGWSTLPLWVVITASVIFLFSYVLYAEVLRENTYLSRTVKVEKNQKVIDTGLYGIIRHPMYASTILLFLMIPFILGSIYSFFIFLFYPILIIIRIQNEEKVLLKELDGYKEYQKKVRYKCIPYIW